MSQDIPLTEEIRLQIFGSRDLTRKPLHLLSDGHSVFTRGNSYENLATPMKTCLLLMGTAVKNLLKFWQS